MALKELLEEELKRVSVSALSKLLEERPYYKITMNDIAETIGVNKSTLYRHALEKDSIMIEAIKKDATNEFAAFMEKDSVFDSSTVFQLLNVTHLIIRNQKAKYIDGSGSANSTIYGAIFDSLYNAIAPHLFEECDLQDDNFRVLVTQDIAGLICNYCRTYELDDKLSHRDALQRSKTVVDLYCQHLERARKMCK